MYILPTNGCNQLVPATYQPYLFGLESERWTSKVELRCISCEWSRLNDASPFLFACQLFEYCLHMDHFISIHLYRKFSKIGFIGLLHVLLCKMYKIISLNYLITVSLNYVSNVLTFNFIFLKFL